MSQPETVVMILVRLFGGAAIGPVWLQQNSNSTKPLALIESPLMHDHLVLSKVDKSCAPVGTNTPALPVHLITALDAIALWRSK